MATARAIASFTAALIPMWTSIICMRPLVRSRPAVGKRIYRSPMSRPRSEGVHEAGRVIDGVHNPLEDRGEVVEGHLEQGLGLDAADGELDLAQCHVRS